MYLTAPERRHAFTHVTDATITMSTAKSIAILEPQQITFSTWLLESPPTCPILTATLIDPLIGSIVGSDRTFCAPGALQSPDNSWIWGFEYVAWIAVLWAVVVVADVMSQWSVRGVSVRNQREGIELIDFLEERRHRG